MNSESLKWWGRNGIAHYFKSKFGAKSACGRASLHGRATRLDPETGKPWRRCEACVKTRGAPMNSAAEPQIALQRWWRAKPAIGGPWCYSETLVGLAEMISDGASPGSAYVIECVALTNEQVANMGDFGGW